ncbi:hypothetical protein [Streptomyces sp. PsTaAH-124]|uniref:hypothetical protein n=1 Tax=Streptomyces sp. PsTaAH-124 TaxID=1157638 RepID=UPI0003AA53B6|nr:hypothetical protein [Streptomyces sp. PsTaAH-124]
MSSAVVARGRTGKRRKAVHAARTEAAAPAPAGPAATAADATGGGWSDPALLWSWAQSAALSGYGPSAAPFIR